MGRNVYDSAVRSGKRAAVWRVRRGVRDGGGDAHAAVEKWRKVTSGGKRVPDLRAPDGANAARSGASWSPGLSRSGTVASE